MALFLTGKWGAVADSFYLEGRLIWSIVWFRLQAAIGVLLGLTAVIDPQLLVDAIGPKGVAAFVVFNAVGSEYLRRRKSAEEGE